jgi:hypothetical protein
MKKTKNKFKKFKEDVKAGFKATAKTIEKEGAAAHKYFSSVAGSASKAFEVTPSKNKVDLLGTTSNTVDLTSPVRKKKRLVKINGQFYWDLR